MTKTVPVKLYNNITVELTVRTSYTWFNKITHTGRLSMTYDIGKIYIWYIYIKTILTTNIFINWRNLKCS